MLDREIDKTIINLINEQYFNNNVEEDDNWQVEVRDSIVQKREGIDEQGNQDVNVKTRAGRVVRSLPTCKII